jgi:hypothetical protein
MQSHSLLYFQTSRKLSITIKNKKKNFLQIRNSKTIRFNFSNQQTFSILPRHVCFFSYQFKIRFPSNCFCFELLIKSRVLQRNSRGLNTPKKSFSLRNNKFSMLKRWNLLWIAKNNFIRNDRTWCDHSKLYLKNEKL